MKKNICLVMLALVTPLSHADYFLACKGGPAVPSKSRANQEGRARDEQLFSTLQRVDVNCQDVKAVQNALKKAVEDVKAVSKQTQSCERGLKGIDTYLSLVSADKKNAEFHKKGVLEPSAPEWLYSCSSDTSRMSAEVWKSIE